MDKVRLTALTESIRRELDEIDSIVLDDVPPVKKTQVWNSADLIKALSEDVRLIELTGNIEGDVPFIVRSNAIITGKFNLGVKTGPAIKVGPNSHAIQIHDVIGMSGTDQSIFEIGANDLTQTTIESTPNDILLDAVDVHTFRGKRAFAINAANVFMNNCRVEDVFDPARRDSQAIFVGNTPGLITVQGGYYEAASECFLSGGDTLKIPGITRKHFRIFDATFTKKMEWKGTVPSVKNIFELKDATDVIIQRCKLFNCWAAAQGGYAFMLTPTQGGQVRDIFIIGCEVYNVSGIANITGKDAHGINQTRTSVTFTRGKFKTNKLEMGGRGDFILATGGPEFIQVHDCDIEIDGNTFIDIADSQPVDYLRVTSCRFNAGLYGIRIGGENQGKNLLGQVRKLEIVGNTISQANSVFKRNFPDNVYI